ncbi:hypothetical protein LGKMAHEF_03868 [Aeromonas salmonicida]
MLQTVDVGTEGRTSFTDLLQHAVHGSDLGSRTSGQGGSRGSTDSGIDAGYFGGCIENKFLINAGTNLESHATGSLEFTTGFQQRSAAESGVVADVTQLFTQFLELGVHGIKILGAVGTIGRLGSQILHALGDVGHLVHGAFSGLDHGDCVLSVAHTNLLTVGLSLQTGSDLQTGSIVGSGVDAQTGTQTLHGGTQHLVGRVQLVLGGHGSKVGMNGQAHGYFLNLDAALQLVR